MKNILLIILILVVGSVVFYLASRSGRLNKTPSSLEITSNVSARILLNNEDRGTTPLRLSALQAGTYTLRLTPLDPSPGYSPYETTISLGKGGSVNVNHSFAPSLPDTSGYTLELSPTRGQESHLSVITDPDHANLTLDNNPQGYTSPQSDTPVTPGSHSLLLTSPGYKSLALTVNISEGYSLLVKAKLALDTIVLSTPAPASSSAEPTASPSASPSTSPSPSPSSSPLVAKPYVEIQETGTGWLRVRSSPSVSSAELGQVDVGTRLEYLGETSDSGWHKVEFDGQEGWVSGKYGQLVK